MRLGSTAGVCCAAHVANWLVSCHLVFLQIGKLSFTAGALELLSLLSRLLQMIGFTDREMAAYSGFCLISFVEICSFLLFTDTAAVMEIKIVSLNKFKGDSCEII